MDLMMPGVDGIEATARIRAELPDVQVIALTSFVEEARVVAALEAGAAGFLLKDAEADELAARSGPRRPARSTSTRRSPGSSPDACAPAAPLGRRRATSTAGSPA
jgi:Response regulator containing a CheY-like receiver domain and an HTH DNA-binding domain